MIVDEVLNIEMTVAFEELLQLLICTHVNPSVL
jgi:hypothetical protein